MLLKLLDKIEATCHHFLLAHPPLLCRTNPLFLVTATYIIQVTSIRLFFHIYRRSFHWTMSDLKLVKVKHVQEQ